MKRARGKYTSMSPVNRPVFDIQLGANISIDYGALESKMAAYIHKGVSPVLVNGKAAGFSVHGTITGRLPGGGIPMPPKLAQMKIKLPKGMTAQMFLASTSNPSGIMDHAKAVGCKDVADAIAGAMHAAIVWPAKVEDE